VYSPEREYSLVSIGWMDRESRILTGLLRDGPLTIRDIAKKSMMSYANAWNVLKALEKSGFVYAFGPKRQLRFEITGRKSEGRVNISGLRDTKRHDADARGTGSTPCGVAE
jgi:DNA-binding Lrp family transcriptional regulator